eukprot:m51a1_g10682 hypothetical protein (604) ;mRNA; r:87610-89512
MPQDTVLVADLLAPIGLSDLCAPLNAGGFIMARSLLTLTHSDMDDLGVLPWRRQALLSAIERYAREQQTAVPSSSPVQPTAPPQQQQQQQQAQLQMQMQQMQPASHALAAAELTALAVAELDRSRAAECRTLLLRAVALSPDCGHALVFLAALREALPALFRDGDPRPHMLRARALAAGSRAAGDAFAEAAGRLESGTAKWLAAAWLETADPASADEQLQARVVALLREGCARGSVLARCALGVRLAFGNGAAQSPREARALLEAAAAQGSAEARDYLGQMAFHGVAGPRDLDEAVELFNAAAEQRHPGAVCNLADCWRTGSGIARDPAIAAQLYRLAASMSHARAAYTLGWCLWTGAGAAQDRAEAVALWSRACDELRSGTSARYLEHARRTPEVPMRAPQPVKPLAPLASLGPAEEACVAACAAVDRGDVARARTDLLGALLADDQFGPAALFLRALRCSFPTAFAAADPEPDELLRAAKSKEPARRGSAFCAGLVAPTQRSATALWLAGHWAEHVDGADPERCAQLYGAALSAGPHALALSSLGSLYAAGRGVPRNRDEAARLLRMAADQGNALAQANLARLQHTATPARAPPGPAKGAE